MDVLINNAKTFLKSKLEKYMQVKDARKQCATCEYLLSLVDKDTPKAKYVSTGFYGTCRCVCGEEVHHPDKYCKHCGQRLV